MPTTNRPARRPGYAPHPGTVWIEANWATLPNNSWVAADQGGLVATAGSMDALQSRLRAASRNESEVSIAFVTEDPV